MLHDRPVALRRRRSILELLPQSLSNLPRQDIIGAGLRSRNPSGKSRVFRLTSDWTLNIQIVRGGRKLSMSGQIQSASLAFTVALIAMAVPASSQTTAPSAAPPVEATAAPATPARPPVARQIVPMVAPIKRVLPSVAAIPAAPKKILPSVAATPPAATVVQASAATPAAPALPLTAKPAASIPAPATKVAAPPKAAPVMAATTRQPKFVAYTCKLGQDYSVARKTCFTPGVTSATVTGTKAATTKTAGATANAKPPIDLTSKSSLGAKTRN